MVNLNYGNLAWKEINFTHRNFRNEFEIRNAGRDIASTLKALSCSCTDTEKLTELYHDFFKAAHEDIKYKTIDPVRQFFLPILPRRVNSPEEDALEEKFINFNYNTKNISTIAALVGSVVGGFIGAYSAREFNADSHSLLISCFAGIGCGSATLGGTSFYIKSKIYNQLKLKLKKIKDEEDKIFRDKVRKCISRLE